MARNVGNYYIKALYTQDIFAHNIAIKIYCNKKYCDKKYCDEEYCDKKYYFEPCMSEGQGKLLSKKINNKPKIKACF